MAKMPEQLPDESMQAYEAACIYFSMGADRSTEKVSKKCGKNWSLMQRWSSQHGWIERAREYDASIAQDAADHQSVEYRERLARYSSRAQRAADLLLSTATKLSEYMDRALDMPAKIKDDRGNEHAIHNFEVSGSTLSAVTRATQMALNIEAHLLGVDGYLGELEADSKEYNPSGQGGAAQPGKQG